MICSPLQPSEKKILKAGERIINRTHHNTLDSIKASVVAGIADIEAFRESKVVLGYR